MPFLDHLAESLLAGELVPDFRFENDPLALADVTVYVPTRRAARELRAIFVGRTGRRAALLPAIRPLGDIDEDAGFFDPAQPALLEMAPPIPALERILLLAPLVRAWTQRLPAGLTALYDESLLVPSSMADAVWLARDLAALMDEIETEEADWSDLAGLVADDLAGWWQVTVEFLKIVTATWPELLAERDRSNPAGHRNAMIDAETERLRSTPPDGPVVAAGSTGSIPATARLLSTVARLPRGAVVLPGLDTALDESAWNLIGDPGADPTVFGHPQYGLKKLLSLIGARRDDVVITGTPAEPLDERGHFLSQAMRPAAVSDSWANDRGQLDAALQAGALDGVTLIEAANEREEAAAIALALRRAIAEPGHRAALVTGDRALARRVSSELRRFGVAADDSAGTPLARTPPAALLRLVLETALRPGDPLAILALLKHPMMRLGMARDTVRRAAEFTELVALRGGIVRPDVIELAGLFEQRLADIASARRKPFWYDRLEAGMAEEIRDVLKALNGALRPLAKMRDADRIGLHRLALATISAFEACGRDTHGIGDLYAGDSGIQMAAFLRALLETDAGTGIGAADWPEVLAALIAGEQVKPRTGGDPRIAIWGALEARLQTVDTLVIGGLNEGTWPQHVEAGQFMSRLMKIGMDLEPPERRIGLAAHDFQMAMGAANVVLSRSARSGEAPSVASRWLQRMLTCAGEDQTREIRERGNELLGWARGLDVATDRPFAPRPEPKPPVEARPTRYSVTEIETLRRDPYAVYARRILGLLPLDPLIGEPDAAQRGLLFHEILHRFVDAGIDPAAADAERHLTDIAKSCFTEAGLPPEVEAVWWPRFAAMRGDFIAWESDRLLRVASRHSEVSAARTAVGDTGVVLTGRADRIDILGDATADILDYKTGSSPSRMQALTLLAPQLALEGALLSRGAFESVGRLDPVDLIYVRLRPNGSVEEESILRHRNKLKPAGELCAEAWDRLEDLLNHYRLPESGFLSRALPFRAEDTDGDYDHLARVLEWSAGAADESDGAGGE